MLSIKKPLKNKFKRGLAEKEGFEYTKFEYLQKPLNSLLYQANVDISTFLLITYRQIKPNTSGKNRESNIFGL